MSHYVFSALAIFLLGFGLYDLNMWALVGSFTFSLAAIAEHNFNTSDDWEG